MCSTENRAYTLTNKMLIYSTLASVVCEVSNAECLEIYSCNHYIAYLSKEGKSMFHKIYRTKELENALCCLTMTLISINIDQYRTTKST